MKTLLKTTYFLVFICLTFLLCFGITGVGYGQAVVSVNPAESPSPGVGQQLTIRLNISNGQNVAGYQVTLNFDTSALRYVSSANGNYLPSGAFFVPPQVSGNEVTLGASSLSGAARGSSGTLASVTFSVVAVTRSTLRLKDVILTDKNVNSLPVHTRNGSVVKGGGAKWDINGDGRVNVLDLTRVATRLGTRDAGADTNADGTVNVLDLVIVAQHLGESVGSPVPQTVEPPTEAAPPVASDFEPCLAIDPRVRASGVDPGFRGGQVSFGVAYTRYVWTASDTIDPNDSDSSLVLKVGFVGGTLNERNLVKRIAPEWTKYGAGLTFKFVGASGSNDTDISVGFIPDHPEGRFWSLPGTKANDYKGFITMNLGGLEGYKYKERVILHEFGHALGLGHEHQNPASHISWDRKAVIAAYIDKWPLKRIEDNILTPLETDQTNFTTFDPESIMLYPIAQHWTIGNFARGWNLVLSQTDKAFIRTLYPSHQPDRRPPETPDRMVLIPAGEFLMGGTGAEARSDEKPLHSVYVDAFYMDKYEVTNKEYVVFLNAVGDHVGYYYYDSGQRGAKHYVIREWVDVDDDRATRIYYAGAYRVQPGYDNHPVTGVSWFGAMAYAAWAGKRLPTEAEWEYAARGGLSGQKYPWRGNNIDPNRANYDGHREGTTRVKTYPANGYGLYDMAGNVWEWCLDEYNEGFYGISQARNPLSGANSIQRLLNNYPHVNRHNARVLRGGSWLANSEFLRVSQRTYNAGPSGNSRYIGFRCVRSASRDETPTRPERSGDPLLQDMVLIPGGEFQMGSNDMEARSDEQPVHTVYIDAFYMDKFEVTNLQYQEFVLANPEWQKDRVPSGPLGGFLDTATAYLFQWTGNDYPTGKANHPVTGVSWFGAMAYAAWAGKRLPTEAEWEYAARGGLSGQKYPWWGNSIDPNKLQYFHTRYIHIPEQVYSRYNRGTTRVGTYPPNGYGLYDMAGNVSEFCLDEYDKGFYAISPARNPLSGPIDIRNLLSGPIDIQEILNNYSYVRGVGVVLRGGDTSSIPKDLRVSSRLGHSAHFPYHYVGFRCVRPVSPNVSR